MRVLWTLIGVLVVATVVVVYAGRDEEDGASRLVDEQPVPSPVMDVASEPAPEPAAEETAPVAEPPPAGEVSELPGTAGEIVEEPPVVAEAPAAAPEPAPSETGARPPDQEALDALAAELLESSRQRQDETVEDVLGVGEGTATTVAAAEEDAPAGDTQATGEPAERTPRQDEAGAADGQFELRGEGTKDDPYRISWELLVSAQETYRPRQGMTKIPERVQKLDDAWVKITGYLSFPPGVTQVDEALVMLNQWDGCCIGVPPSPYDAIEARLSRPVNPRKGHFLRFGSVKGKLQIDPYLVNDWLVGLYLMEETEIEVEL